MQNVQSLPYKDAEPAVFIKLDEKSTPAAAT